MQQVFFITDDRMTVMLWQGASLISKYEFEENEADISDLIKYLEESREMTASIILDVLEDEFTLTTIPHVSPGERKFLIQRALTRLHRSSEFSTARIIGRESEGRRDDQLLVSGLTADRPLLKWLDILNQHKIIIKGIYSLPLVAGNLLKVLKVKKGLTLLVSRQSRDFIRQSIFNDGKLFYSRNIPSPDNFNINVFSSDLKNTKKYLENQKLLHANDSINVMILSSNKFFGQLQGLDDLLPDMNITYVKHEDLKGSLDIISDTTIGGQEIFSALLLNSMDKNNYGRKTDLKLYKEKIKRSWINYSSVALAVVLVMLSVKLYIDNNILDQRVAGIAEQISVLKQQNDRLEVNLSKLPVKAIKIKTFVDNITDIEHATASSIEKPMIRISQVFNAFSKVSLTKFDWDLSASDDIRAKKFFPKGKTPIALSEHQFINITASVDNADLNKQQTMRLVKKLIASIEGLEKVTSVEITRLPINASSNNRLSGVVSKSAKDISEFEFVVFMERESDAS